MDIRQHFKTSILLNIHIAMFLANIDGIEYSYRKAFKITHYPTIESIPDDLLVEARHEAEEKFNEIAENNKAKENILLGDFFTHERSGKRWYCTSITKRENCIIVEIVQYKDEK